MIASRLILFCISCVDGAWWGGCPQDEGRAHEGQGGGKETRASEALSDRPCVGHVGAGSMPVLEQCRLCNGQWEPLELGAGGS